MREQLKYYELGYDKTEYTFVRPELQHSTGYGRTVNTGSAPPILNTHTHTHTAQLRRERTD